MPRSLIIGLCLALFFAVQTPSSASTDPQAAPPCASVAIHCVWIEDFGAPAVDCPYSMDGGFCMATRQGVGLFHLAGGRISWSPTTLVPEGATGARVTFVTDGYSFNPVHYVGATSGLCRNGRTWYGVEPITTILLPCLTPGGELIAEFASHAVVTEAAIFVKSISIEWTFER